MAPKKRGRQQKAEEKAEEKVLAVPKKRLKPASDAASKGSDSATLRPVIVFAHGAGAGSSSDWMVRWKQLLASVTNAADVITFDYPYLGGRKLPPKAEKLVDFHITQIDNALSSHPGCPLVLAGKSMGSRVSCMIAGRPDINVAAVICLGYPLKATNGSMRDSTLLEMQAPVIFVQGTKDPMCPLDKLEAVQKKMVVQNKVHVIDGGDHSFKVPVAFMKKNGVTPADIEKQAASAINVFLTEVLSK